jgi:hypothetical protein
MKNVISTAIILGLLITAPALAGDEVFKFKNPSFSGQGYSSHVLSIEQLQFTRKKDIEDKAESDAARAKREAESTNLAKLRVESMHNFLSNWLITCSMIQVLTAAQLISKVLQYTG